MQEQKELERLYILDVFTKLKTFVFEEETRKTCRIIQTTEILIQLHKIILFATE